MLSRIAESFFWLGRYVERAEATARLLSEHHQLLVEDRSVPEEMGCALLLDSLTMPSARGRDRTGPGPRRRRQRARVVHDRRRRRRRPHQRPGGARLPLAGHVRGAQLRPPGPVPRDGVHGQPRRRPAPGPRAPPRRQRRRRLDDAAGRGLPVHGPRPRARAHRHGRPPAVDPPRRDVALVRPGGRPPCRGGAVALPAHGQAPQRHRRPPVPRARRDVPPVDALLRGGRGGGRPRPAATGRQRQRLAAARGRHAALGAGVRPRARRPTTSRSSSTRPARPPSAHRTRSTARSSASTARSCGATDDHPDRTSPPHRPPHRIPLRRCRRRVLQRGAHDARSASTASCC